MEVASRSDFERAATRLPGLPATIAFAGGACILVLGAAVALVLATDHPFSYFSRDPAAQAGESPSIGFVSHAGVLLTWAAAVVCLSSGRLVAPARGWIEASPLLVAGVGTAYLALDDLFLLHEDVYPTKLGVGQELVLAVYLLLAIAFLWRFRDVLRRHEWPLLALAGCALGGSLALDVTNYLVSSRVERFFEESLKLFGLAFLCAYFLRLSARTLLDAYSLPVRQPDLALEAPHAASPPAPDEVPASLSSTLAP
jgi:hypothetical protein